MNCRLLDIDLITLAHWVGAYSYVTPHTMYYYIRFPLLTAGGMLFMLKLVPQVCSIQIFMYYWSLKYN